MSSTRPAPRFSVVVPTYERPDQIERCLGALSELAEPDGGFEVIVVDDGSATPLDDVARRFRDRLDLRLVRQSNRGPASARNAGVAKANGEYVVFTDDDCRPCPDWLREFSRVIETEPEAGLGGAVRNALEGSTGSTASQLLVDYLYGYFNVPEPEFFTSNNLCVPRRAFDELGGFDVSFPLAAGEDREFCSRWRARGGRFRFVPEATIDHAHPLSLRAFWRQHFGYGRGAWHFHSLRAEREGRRLRVEPLRFYLGLLAFPFRRLRWPRAALVAVWLVLAQAANAAGFFSERRRSRRRRASARAGA